MERNGLGDLREWVTVLGQLEQVKKAGALDDYQGELVRILRYRDNWRLTERALEYAGEISRPSDELISTACRVMVDDNVCIDNRILAAAALGALVPKKLKLTSTQPRYNGAAIVDIMQGLLDAPQAPVFHAAVSQAVQNMK